MKSKIAWLATWIAGCVIFDAVLGASGGWLMAGGAFTYMACEWVEGRVR